MYSAILHICWQDVVPLALLELRYWNWSQAKSLGDYPVRRRLARLSHPEGMPRGD